MRIGIFGGTYNPIHLGHTALASYICNLGLVDEVWLMVSPQNPFKQDHQLLDEAIRLRLATLAVRDFPRLRASDFEFHLPRPSFTYVTLQELSRAYPDDAFSLIIGADNWDKFSEWRNADDILAHYPIIVYPRETVSDERLAVSDGHMPTLPSLTGGVGGGSPIFLSSAPLYPISSTAIRTAIAAGDDVSPWLDPAVLDEIRRLRLYAQ
ncbi:MAG: nicotinate (nicotinamide) nucleotide adenylyltransferase [Bacteroidaceae bacterium]|nr:nicotinate (nicotinamide) nucleotide adenylyltransferase [Bacteroidaceae bacterium]